MGDSSFGMLDSSATLNAWCSQTQYKIRSSTRNNNPRSFICEACIAEPHLTVATYIIHGHADFAARHSNYCDFKLEYTPIALASYSLALSACRT